MFNRHCLVYTTSYPWSTVVYKYSDTEDMIARKCDIKLLQLENGNFCEVRSKEIVEKPKPKRCKTASLQQILRENMDNKKENQGYNEQRKQTNTVTANISTSNILPNNSSDTQYNTRP